MLLEVACWPLQQAFVRAHKVIVQNRQAVVVQSLPAVVPELLGTQSLWLAVSPDGMPACVQEPDEEVVPQAAARRAASAPRKRVAIEVSGASQYSDRVARFDACCNACKPLRPTVTWNKRAAVDMRLCCLDLLLRNAAMSGCTRDVGWHADPRWTDQEAVMSALHRGRPACCARQC